MREAVSYQRRIEGRSRSLNVLIRITALPLAGGVAAGEPPAVRPAGCRGFISRPRETRRLVRRAEALIESVAVFGLVVAFIGQDARLFLPLFALSIAGMLATYPSDSMLRKLTPS